MLTIAWSSPILFVGVMSVVRSAFVPPSALFPTRAMMGPLRSSHSARTWEILLFLLTLELSSATFCYQSSLEQLSLELRFLKSVKKSAHSMQPRLSDLEGRGRLEVVHDDHRLNGWCRFSNVAPSPHSAHHRHTNLRSPVVDRGDSVVALLPGSVPDLESDVPGVLYSHNFTKYESRNF